MQIHRVVGLNPLQVHNVFEVPTHHDAADCGQRISKISRSVSRRDSNGKVAVVLVLLDALTAINFLNASLDKR